MSVRQSTADAPQDDDLIITDERDVAQREASNGLLQFDEVLRLTQLYAGRGRLTLTTELMCELNRIAIDGIRHSAGQLRRCAIEITNTQHVPPPFESVAGHMAAMCEYVNGLWDAVIDPVDKALHIAAYLMWRLNWIHPFRDGNGRTSRAVSYLYLGICLGRELIGTPTIPDQIVDQKTPYYDALDAADAAWSDGKLDVRRMEQLIEALLMRQLAAGLR